MSLNLILFQSARQKCGSFFQPAEEQCAAKLDRTEMTFNLKNSNFINLVMDFSDIFFSMLAHY